jgi:P27 family predicted phage terminase small subunit
MRGSWRAKARPDEPQIPATKTQPPPWLFETSRRQWEHIAPLLEQVGILTEADQAAFALYADALAQYIEARDAVYGKKGKKGTGLYTETLHGSQAVHPAVRIMEGAWDRAMKASREFGLTPASRAGVTKATSVNHADTDQKARFFRHKA